MSQSGDRALESIAGLADDTREGWEFQARMEQETESALVTLNPQRRICTTGTPLFE